MLLVRLLVVGLVGVLGLVLVFLFLGLLLGGLDLVLGEVGPAQAGLEGEGVNLGGVVEVGVGLVVAPGGADHGAEGAVGEEEEPLAVGAPRGGVGRVAVAGNGGGARGRGGGALGGGIAAPELDLVVGVRRAGDVGEPAAVGGPGEVGEVVDGAGVDAGVGLGLGVEDPELVVLVVVGDELAVGRGEGAPFQDRAAGGELRGVADAVGGHLPHLDLAGFVGEGDERVGVFEEAGIAVAHTVVAHHIHDAALAVGDDEDAAACRDGDLFAVGREVSGGDPVDGLFHPALTHLVEIGVEGDGDGVGLAAGDVEDVDVGLQLVDDAARAGGVEARAHDVEADVPGVLLDVLAVGRHGPDVHVVVAVGEEVDAALKPQGALAGAGVVAGEVDGLGLAFLEVPELLDGAALVALGEAAVEGDADEGDGRVVHGRGGGGCGVEGGVSTLGQRDEGSRAGGRVDERRLLAGQGAELVGAGDDAAVGGPALHAAAGIVPSQALGHAAGHGHDVDLLRAFIAGDESEPLAVGRDGGLELSRGVGGEARGDAALVGDLPEVALGGEDDGVFFQGGLAVVAQGGTNRGRSDDAHGRGGGQRGGRRELGAGG